MGSFRKAELALLARLAVFALMAELEILRAFCCYEFSLLNALKGHDFSRAVKSAKSSRALASEGN
jgi:hypothetical protein